MKKLVNLLLLVFSILIGYYSYTALSGKLSVIGIFVSGVCFGIFLMSLRLNVKNDVLKSYKRELEKETISSDEASAKVRVLESKIQVLEKALENALNK